MNILRKKEGPLQNEAKYCARFFIQVSKIIRAIEFILTFQLVDMQNDSQVDVGLLSKSLFIIIQGYKLMGGRVFKHRT